MSDDELTPAEQAWRDWLDGNPSTMAVSRGAFEAGAAAERKALDAAWREVLDGDPDRWLNVRHLGEMHRQIFRTDKQGPVATIVVAGEVSHRPIEQWRPEEG